MVVRQDELDVEDGLRLNVGHASRHAQSHCVFVKSEEVDGIPQVHSHSDVIALPIKSIAEWVGPGLTSDHSQCRRGLG